MSTPRYGVISLRLVLLLVFTLASSNAALAAICTWTGLGTSNRWSNAQNWTACNGGIPVNGDSLSFQTNAAQRVNENDIPGLRVVSIFVQDRGQASAPFEISGLALTVSTRVHAVKAIGSTGAGTILRLPLAMHQANGEIFVEDSGTTLTITGRITGPPIGPNFGTMHLSGMGTLVLANATNTWQHVTMSDVTVRIGVAGAWPDNSELLMIRAATLVLNDLDETIGTLAGASNTIVGPRIQLNGRATLTVQQLFSEIFEGTISGTGSLVKDGGGRLTMADPWPGRRRTPTPERRPSVRASWS